MEIKIKQISSLEKVRVNDKLDHVEIHKKSVLAGERISYQICMKSAEPVLITASVESPLADCVKLYHVKDAYMDVPVTADVAMEDYITQEPGFMPDILVPMEETNDRLSLSNRVSTLWVKVDVPKAVAPGIYPVNIKLTANFINSNVINADTVLVFYETMTIEVVPAIMPEQKLIYTRWFYADCIAVAHGVEIFSEAHWELIDKYIAAATDVGINMILVPIHTPPLDTEIGTKRPCVQLVDIEKKGERYEFSFPKFRHFIDICKKNGIQYFEMAHMFSQWGAKCAPNIMVTENGRTDYVFGWQVAADSDEYVSFLKQYIAAISEELEKEGISESTYFHISDEPTMNNIDTYKTASEIIRPLIGNSKTFDALSNYVFYEKGLVECPVTSVSHVHEFLEHDIPNQWVYYCCGPQRVFPSISMSFPSYRARILGFLLYKYDIKGFLHWGFNYYNAVVSVYPINPYLTTSGDGAYPSGDPFIVYPAKGDVYPSIRGEVTYEAIQDVNVCFALEKLIGRENVVRMIDEAAGSDLRFDDYPRCKEFIESLRAKMVEQIGKLCVND
ncbi:MAG: DUF4091 domain-containing protein [Roseburia sp.]|nr:DUF4091 domain-containing protein [Roseburia sp.]